MHKSRTRWPLETRVKLVAIYEELRRHSPRYAASEVSRYHDVPYSRSAAGWPAGGERGASLWLTVRLGPDVCPMPSRDGALPPPSARRAYNTSPSASTP